jgi:hypothetical protein
MDVYEALHDGNVGGNWRHLDIHNARGLVPRASMQSRV